MTELIAKLITTDQTLESCITQKNEACLLTRSQPTLTILARWTPWILLWWPLIRKNLSCLRTKLILHLYFFTYSFIYCLIVFTWQNLAENIFSKLFDVFKFLLIVETPWVIVWTFYFILRFFSAQKLGFHCFMEITEHESIIYS